EAGVDAVDRRALGDDGLDHLRAAQNGGAGRFVQAHVGALVDLAPLGQRNVAGTKHERGIHRVTPVDCKTGTGRLQERGESRVVFLGEDLWSRLASLIRRSYSCRSYGDVGWPRNTRVCRGLKPMR